MLRWIDRRCRQGTGRFDLPFGGISVILVGDIVQLPPVLEKGLYHKKPNEENETTGFLIYRLFDKVANLTKNERSKGENNDQKRFRQLLLNLRNGDSTESYWNLLQSRTPDSVGRKKYTKEYVKALQSLHVPIAQINARHIVQQPQNYLLMIRDV